ncbi:VOC family protein [Microbacterium halotolerans]|uniref:VOC family protein n=1 Tax=Microbacterium halotolerans TaxID=246613 RepID=UPI000E6AA63A|nr:VOC family protein [Microbacterium halotolerans]
MDNITPVTGTHTTDGRPNSFTALTPFLALRDARAAVDFYVAHLGASLLGSTEFPGPDGPIVVHAELDFDGAGRLQVGEANAGFATVPPSNDGTASCSLGLYVRDVDAVTSDLVAHGATLREEPSTFVSGDRYSSVLDPFGVRWSIMTRVEDLSDEESAARVAEWAAAQG